MKLEHAVRTSNSIMRVRSSSLSPARLKFAVGDRPEDGRTLLKTDALPPRTLKRHECRAPGSGTVRLWFDAAQLVWPAKTASPKRQVRTRTVAKALAGSELACRAGLRSRARWHTAVQWA